MALTHSPRIVTEGLVFSMDAVNPKSWNTGVGISTNWVDTVGNNNGTLSTNLLHTDGPFSGAGGHVGFGTTTVDHLNIESGSEDFKYRKDAFTIECWVYPIWDNTTDTLIALLDNGTGGSNNLVIHLRSKGNGNTVIGYASYFQGVDMQLPSNQWFHFACSRATNSNIRVYINGVQKGNYDFGDKNLNGSGAIKIGKKEDSSRPFEGYISNFRIIKGVDLYPNGTTFTPSKKPLTVTPETVLLTCKGNRVVDAVGIHTITTGTDGINLTKEPFDGAGAYGFNGTADYMTISDDSDFTFGTGDLTVEAFVKLSSNATVSNYHTIISCGFPVQLYWYDNKFEFYAASANSATYFVNGADFNSGSNSAVRDVWHHIAVTRSGNDFKMFLNGALVDSASSSTSFADPNVDTTIGATNLSGTANFADGEISNLRITKGTALYTGDFTPPTTSLESIDNTILLTLQGENIKDVSSSAHTITRSGAIFSNTVSKSFEFKPSLNTEASLPSGIDIAGNELTLSLWNYGREARDSSVIELEDSNGFRQLNVHLPWGDSKVYFDKGSTNSSNYDRISRTATVNEYQGWHHWVFTANASTGSMKIYLDGALWHSGTGKNKPILTPDGNCLIGRQENIAANHHNAFVSNLQLFKNEFTAEQVLSHYNVYKERFDL